MTFVPIFDLDDTLYDEVSFVISGFTAVANALESKFGWPRQQSFNFMMTILRDEGRGQVFNRLLESHGIFSAREVVHCVKVYRSHIPSINLPKGSEEILKSLKKKSYLVTDGHKIVQKNKISALKIQDYFKKIFITHRYGIKSAKPSIYCFELIKKIENCNWSDMFYVGDNPTKDFVNLNSLGVKTIRVLTGSFANAKPNKLFEAQYIIRSLEDLPRLLEELF